MAKTNATTERDHRLESIATRCLNIPTLQRRNSDQLDFHEVSVWSLLQALRLAYAAGMEQAITDGAPDESSLVPPNFACPGCGERDMDQLICDEDGESVACQKCGTSYVVAQLD